MLLILSHSLRKGAISGAKVMKINRICNTVKAMCLQNFFGGTYAVWLPVSRGDLCGADSRAWVTGDMLEPDPVPVANSMGFTSSTNYC